MGRLQTCFANWANITIVFTRRNFHAEQLRSQFVLLEFFQISFFLAVVLRGGLDLLLKFFLSFLFICFGQGKYLGQE